MREEVTLRRATPDDVDAVVDVWLRSFAAALPTVRRAHDDDEVEAWFRHVVLPTQEVWVATSASTPTGLLVLHGDEISQLYLAPEWRGHGIGDRLIALAKGVRPRGLTLWTFEVNGAARRFYERHGFTVVDHSAGADNEEHEPAVRYAWTPTPISSS